jgi:hypothetical protein
MRTVLKSNAYRVSVELLNAGPHDGIDVITEPKKGIRVMLE